MAQAYNKDMYMMWTLTGANNGYDLRVCIPGITDVDGPDVAATVQRGGSSTDRARNPKRPQLALGNGLWPEVPEEHPNPRRQKRGHLRLTRRLSTAPQTS